MNTQSVQSFGARLPKFSRVLPSPRQTNSGQARLMEKAFQVRALEPPKAEAAKKQSRNGGRGVSNYRGVFSGLDVDPGYLYSTAARRRATVSTQPHAMRMQAYTRAVTTNHPGSRPKPPGARPSELGSDRTGRAQTARPTHSKPPVQTGAAVRETQDLLVQMQAQREGETERWREGTTGAPRHGEPERWPFCDPQLEAEVARLESEKDVYRRRLEAAEAETAILRARVATLSQAANHKAGRGQESAGGGYTCHVLWDVGSLGIPTVYLHGGVFADRVRSVVVSHCGLPLRHSLRFVAFHSPSKAKPLPRKTCVELREAGVQLVDIGVESNAGSEAGAGCVREWIGHIIQDARPGFASVVLLTNTVSLSVAMKQLQDAGHGVFCLHEHPVMSDARQALELHASRVLSWDLITGGLEHVSAHHIDIGDRRASLEAQQHMPRATTAPGNARPRRMTKGRASTRRMSSIDSGNPMVAQDRLSDAGSQDRTLPNMHRIEGSENPLPRVSVSANGRLRQRSAGGGPSAADVSVAGGSEAGSVSLEMGRLPEDLESSCGDGAMEHFPMPPLSDRRRYGAESPWSVGGESDLGDITDGLPSFVHQSGGP